MKMNNEVTISILIYQIEGSSIDWVNRSYIGPFYSKEERDKYIADNPCGRKARYIVEYLSKE